MYLLLMDATTKGKTMSKLPNGRGMVAVDPRGGALAGLYGRAAHYAAVAAQAAKDGCADDAQTASLEVDACYEAARRYTDKQADRRVRGAKVAA